MGSSPLAAVVDSLPEGEPGNHPGEEELPRSSLELHRAGNWERQDETSAITHPHRTGDVNGGRAAYWRFLSGHGGGQTRGLMAADG